MEKNAVLKMQRSKRAGGEGGGNVEYSPLAAQDALLPLSQVALTPNDCIHGLLGPRTLGGLGPWETPARSGRGERWRSLCPATFPAEL